MSDLLSRPVAYSGRSSFAARRGLLRELDWVLIAVTAGLTAIGTVLVWSATAPMLEAAGLSTHTYLKKQLLNVALGVVLLVAFSVMDHRRLRAYVPLAYGVSLVLLVGVLASAPVNGAHAWIELPGGFQLEPSEFAKLGLIGAAALILSPRTIGHPRPGLKHVALAVLAALPLIGGARRHGGGVRHPAVLGGWRGSGRSGRCVRGGDDAPAARVPAHPAHLVLAPGK
jgi:cell division protein FtsW (lipid II flippase)